MKRAWLVCLALFALEARAQDVRGIYVFSNDVSQISSATAKNITSALAINGTDGLALDIGWDAIEPTMGHYDFSLLDQWMQTAITAHKKIDLVIPAGDATPSWVFQPAPVGAGVTPLDFTISPHSGQTGICDSETMAAPWDAAFLAQFDLMLAAVAAHLKANNTYASVTLVRITGINRTTEEMRLPVETPQSTGLQCVTNAITTWQQAGYKPSLLLSAWDKITTSFNKSFPDKPFSVSIIPTNPFPAIAEDGSVIHGNVPDANQPLMALASQKFPGRFIVQFDFLMPGEAASPAVIGYSQTLGTKVAFQTNEYLGQTGQGAACSEPVTNPTPCTATTFLQLLQTGIFPLGFSNPLRAQYIEVFPANVNAFPFDIFAAHDELVPPARRHAARH